MVFELVVKTTQGIEYQGSGEPNYTGLFFPGALLLSIVLIYFQAKRIYRTAKSLHEPITYTFTEDRVTLKSDSLDSETNWDTFTKVVETKRLFIFYKSPTLANLIPKANLEENQIKALRALVFSQPGLKHKLKKPNLLSLYSIRITNT